MKIVYFSLIEDFKTMLLLVLLPVMFLNYFASAEEESVSINKPRTRSQHPWADSIKTDYVRCFCNLPSCVVTSYMCKSNSGGCFSDLLDSSRNSVYRGKHGCVEYLTESQRSRCPVNNQDGQNHTRNKERPKSLLVCCTMDMCNHADNPFTKNLLNNTLGGDSEGKFQHQEQRETYLYSNSEVWFRAATIAVPICGAVILFALIAVAVKILKTEHQNSLNQKLAMYVVPSTQQNDRWSDNSYKPCIVKRPYYNQAHPNSFLVRPPEEDAHDKQFQIPLLVTNEVRDFTTVNNSSSVNESKNDANAKLNLIQCESNSSRSIILEIGKSSPSYSLTANMNLNSKDKFCKNEKHFVS